MAGDDDVRQQVLLNTLEEVSASAGALRNDDPCVICLESISERAVAQPCQHSSYDFICLVSWLQERSTCPLCKSEITSVRYNITSTGFKTFEVSSTSLQKQSQAPTSSISQQQTRNRVYGTRPRHWSQRARGNITIPTADEAVLRRRYIYRNNLYSLHVGSNRLSRFKDFTPESFRDDPELASRARKWIRRELQVFEFLSIDSESGPTSRRANNAEFLLEYIIAILKTVDIKGSAGQAEEMLQEFLGRDHARLFLHELNAWLRSPYSSLQDWDRAIQYSASLPKNSELSRAMEQRDCSEPAPARSNFQHSRSASAQRYSPRYNPYQRR